MFIHYSEVSYRLEKGTDSYFRPKLCIYIHSEDTSACRVAVIVAIYH